jgi:hypothetical protein
MFAPKVSRSPARFDIRSHPQPRDSASLPQRLFTRASDQDRREDRQKQRTGARGHVGLAGPMRAPLTPVAPLPLLRPRLLQTKLRIGALTDPLEREADRVADQVMRMSLTNVPSFGPGQIHRKCAACQKEEQEAAPQAPVQISRKCAHCDGEEKVMQKTSGISSSDTQSLHREAPPLVHQVLHSPGQPLATDDLAFFTPRFGFDFSRVRIHNDRTAAESARSVNALAYASGSDIAFAAGQYQPGTETGRRLLAHELAHVVQQRTENAYLGGETLYRKAKAIRFQDEPTLDDISDGKKTLAQGDKGEAVIRIGSALAEIGTYAAASVDETFNPPLTSAVNAYQGSKPALKGKVPAGKVDKLTFDELDTDFSSSYKVERDIVSKQKAPSLLTGTQSLDAAEKKASARAISTEPRVNPVTGLAPKFVPDIAGKGKYEDRLSAMVEKIIVSQYDRLGKGRAAAHADPKKLYDWTQIEIIAKESQKAVDKVFSQYYTGKTATPLKQGVNIFDAWDDKVATLKAGGKPQEDHDAAWRVEKIITGESSVAALDQEHGVVQSRAPEAAIISSVKTKLVAKYRTELIEIHKGWPGFEDKGKIFIQRFKGATSDRQRWDMWRYYQTFIHEYIHSLENTAHVAYRQTMTEQKGDKALREGVTDYFTKIVWSSITIDAPLRKTIEGPFHDPANNFAVQGLTTYRESENAERLAGVVGLRNLAAAFFLGKVDLIGKP